MEIKAIAHIQGCFPDKFAIPRQGIFSSQARAELIFTKEFQNPNWFKGLKLYSHIWLIWGFHEHFTHAKLSPMVRPQRLGGNQKMGTFATRSSFRPNYLGLSVVKIERFVIQNNQAQLIISGHYLQNATPIFDIKPYLPINDCLNEASTNFADTKPRRFKVDFTQQALQDLVSFQTEIRNLEQYFAFNFKQQIEELIAQDPRPAYQFTEKWRIHGLKLYQFDIKFHFTGEGFEVLSLAI